MSLFLLLCRTVLNPGSVNPGWKASVSKIGIIGLRCNDIVIFLKIFLVDHKVAPTIGCLLTACGMSVSDSQTNPSKGISIVTRSIWTQSTTLARCKAFIKRQ